MVELLKEVEMSVIKRDGCGRRISDLVQCQSCGYCVKHDSIDDAPQGWTIDSSGLLYCDECYITPHQDQELLQ